MTHLTQDFKDKCEKLLLEWQTIIGKDWSPTPYKDIKVRVEKDKGKVLNDPFFTSFKDKSIEEQIWMFSRIKYWYLEKLGEGSNTGLPTCLKNMKEAVDRENTSNEDLRNIGQLAFLVFQLRTDFIKMVGIEKWNDPKNAWYEEIWNYWQKELRPSFEDKSLHPEGYKLIKPKLDKLKTDLSDREHTIKDLNKQLSERPTDEKIKDLNKQLTDKDLELGKRTEIINTLTTERDTLKTSWDENFKKFQASFSKTGFEFLRETIDLILEVDSESKVEIATKLIDFVKAEIKKRAELFYSTELSLDKSDDIDPQYNGDYLAKLKDLKFKSDPERVINAFKLVALIVKTQQLQKEYDDLKDKKISAQIKKNKLYKCREVKKKWDLITMTPTEKHNPLWLPIIKESRNYLNKLENIINQWQQI